MKFEINKNSLLEILKTNTTITKNDGYNPVLNCVYIEAKNDQIIFIHSNGSISIKTSLTDGFKIFEEGTMLIKNKFLLDIISKVYEKNITLEKFDNTVCKLSTESFKCQINIMDELSYPNINFDYKNFIQLNLKNKDILKITTKIASCVSSNGESHRNISGIGFQYNNEKEILSVSGTDAYKLATLSIPLKNNDSFNFIMDLSVSKILNALVSSQPSDNETSLFINKETNEIVFEINNIVVTAKNIDGNFIEVSKYFNNLGDQTFEVDKSKLISALERGFAFVSSDKVAQVVLNITEKNIEIDFNSYELGASQEKIEISNREGTNGKINVNAKYLISILKNIDNETVKFNYFYEVRPIVLTDPRDKTFKQLVLPIRAN